MSIKPNYSDYTELEFDGSDLLYYPANELEGCAVGVIARIIAWRKSMGLPLFKDVQ